MGFQSTLRARQAAERRLHRDAQKRFRELERQTKERAKLSTMEQARLEVETYENALEVLLSVHKEQGEVWDWLQVATALPPCPPRRFPRRELKARQQAELAALPSFRSAQAYDFETAIAQARLQDEQEFQTALASFAEEKAEWERMNALAPRVLAGEAKAYTEALVEFSPLAELSDLGSSIYFTVHHAKLVECILKVSGRQSIPAETKMFTASGKLSIKAMPKARFHEIYQDYVCGCVLRVAREVFALLPVETVLVTATVDGLDPSTGAAAEHPVLSVAIPRVGVKQLNFDLLDPSDSMENFLRRGDVKASRKSGEFAPVTPLTPADLSQGAIENADLRELEACFQRLRSEVTAEIKTLDKTLDSQFTLDVSPPHESL